MDKWSIVEWVPELGIELSTYAEADSESDANIKLAMLKMVHPDKHFKIVKSRSF